MQPYGVQEVSKKCAFELFKHIRHGKEGVEDEPRSSRPSISITPDNIERVLKMIVADSPDLARADLFLFPRLKLALKRLRFPDVADINPRVTMMLQVSQEALSDSF
ncbi:hypothetical protein C0J52_22259 [Blattella germanica]|nr:hypothetical protein C0J52_22259 [Blattella germanica]